MDRENFEKNIAVFSFRQLQDFVTFSKVLKSHGHTIVDVENYIETKQHEIASSMDAMRSIHIKCPECGTPMMILPVNDKPSTRTGDDSKSVMMCRNQKCLHTEYSNKTVGEIIKDLNKEKDHGL